MVGEGHALAELHPVGERDPLGHPLLVTERSAVMMVGEGHALTENVALEQALPEKERRAERIVGVAVLQPLERPLPE